MRSPDCTAFGTLCQAIYQRSRPYSSQAKFVLNLITATGASSQGVSTDLATKVFRGERSLTVDFPDRLDEEKFTAFFRQCIELPGSTDEQRDERCVEIACALESPIEGPIDRDRFYRALTAYVDDIVHPPRHVGPFSAYYLSDQKGDQQPAPLDLRPLHAGDHVTNFSAGHPTPLRLRTYERIDYEFMLMNDGSVDWDGRILRCTNPTDDRLRPTETEVPVPSTAPSRSRRIGIPLVLRAQHMEGETCSRWVMLDKHGNDCFPDDPELFDIMATVVFVPGKEDTP